MDQQAHLQVPVFEHKLVPVIYTFGLIPENKYKTHSFQVL